MLLGTAFALAFLTLASAPHLLGHVWRAIKCTAIVSVAVRTVTELWPWVPDHPWVVGGVGLGQVLAARVHDAAWTAVGYGAQVLLPLLRG